MKTIILRDKWDAEINSRDLLLKICFSNLNRSISIIDQQRHLTHLLGAVFFENTKSVSATVSFFIESKPVLSFCAADKKINFDWSWRLCRVTAKLVSTGNIFTSDREKSGWGLMY